jgi:hypothetical protein
MSENGEPHKIRDAEVLSVRLGAQADFYFQDLGVAFWVKVSRSSKSLVCICIVFAPMFQLGGVAGYLFRPLAEAVIFALIGSFLLSRTWSRRWPRTCCGRVRPTAPPMFRGSGRPIAKSAEAFSTRVRASI